MDALISTIYIYIFEEYGLYDYPFLCVEIMIFKMRFIYIYIYIYIYTEILRFRGGTVLLKVSKIVILVYMCVHSCEMCVICSQIKFITNITNVTGIHTFYFYNDRYIFITTDTTFTTKHTYFIKINTFSLNNYIFF